MRANAPDECNLIAVTYHVEELVVPVLINWDCKVRKRMVDADGGRRTADFKINNNKIYLKNYIN